MALALKPREEGVHRPCQPPKYRTPQAKWLNHFSGTGSLAFEAWSHTTSERRLLYLCPFPGHWKFQASPRRRARVPPAKQRSSAESHATTQRPCVDPYVLSRSHFWAPIASVHPA